MNNYTESFIRFEKVKLNEKNIKLNDAPERGA